MASSATTAIFLRKRWHPAARQGAHGIWGVEKRTRLDNRVRKVLREFYGDEPTGVKVGNPSDVLDVRSEMRDVCGNCLQREV